MAEIVINASLRDQFGKGAARRLRRDRLIPAVLYGHGGATQHLALPAHATTMALRGANALLDLRLPGGGTQLALPRQVQRDPVRDAIEHVDLIGVRRGEKVQVEVPLLVTGEVRDEGVVILDQTTVLVSVEATNIPAHIEISVADQEIGFTVVAGDLNLPEGASFVGQPDDLILSVQVPQAKDMGEITITEEADAEPGDEA